MDTPHRTGVTTIALVPINSLVLAKSRLRGELSDADRIGLVEWLAERVVRALRHSAVVARVLVVSPDARVLARFAGDPMVTPLRARGGNLNADLTQGRRQASADGCQRLLIALGDLPLLDAAAVGAMVALLERTAPRDERAMVLAPDRAESGTNLMLAQPADAIPFAFGAQSLARHVERARAAGIEPLLYRSNETSFDVDAPADVRELMARGLWAPSHGAERPRQCDAGCDAGAPGVGKPGVGKPGVGKPGVGEAQEAGAGGEHHGGGYSGG